MIYEVVPPRKDTSRFSTELRGIEEVLHDSRIAAINIPELINRKKDGGRVHYSPATIPPEEYAMMIKDYKEAVVNIIAPRLPKEDFLRRAKKILHEYQVPNLVLVGRERHDDALPGPAVIEALRLLVEEKRDNVAFGGICIFNRESSTTEEYGGVGSPLTEPRRVWAKADVGCDFVTSQITFDAGRALKFKSYQELCERTKRTPLTVFVSLTTVTSASILSLIESLDAVIPPEVRRRLLRSDNMGKSSLMYASEVFHEIVTRVRENHIRVPLGLQIEQIGVNSGDLSLDLLDQTYPILKER